MFEFLNNLVHKITVGSVDFRKNVSEMVEKANQGYAVVITVNNKPKAVLVAPQVAEAFFSEHEQVLTAGDGNEDFQPMTEENLAEAASQAGVAGLPECPACVGTGDMHETMTRQHPTEADIPDGSKVFDEAGNPVETDSPQPNTDLPPVMEAPVHIHEPGESFETPVASAVETPEATSTESTTEASVAQNDNTDQSDKTGEDASVSSQTETTEPADQPEPVLTPELFCQASIAAPGVVCDREAVGRVNWRGFEINICAFHLAQLNEKNQAYSDLGKPV